MLYTHNNKWEKVKDLTASHSLFTHDNLERIKSVRRLDKKQDLYDIEVAEKHEYYANGIVSHNSSMFAGLLYALFGQLLQGGVKNENVVNKYAGDKDMRLVLTFDVDGRPYKAVRGLNRGKLSYFELWDGDQNVTKSTIAETQRFLERDVIKCDASIFLRTLLLTSRQTYNFYELKKADKKEFIEKLFDLSVFGDMYQAIHRDALAADRKMLEHQNRLLVMNKSDSDYKARIAQYEEQKAGRLRSLDESIRQERSEYEQQKAKAVESHAAEAAKLEAAV